jgi:hypothetical protein
MSFVCRAMQLCRADCTLMLSTGGVYDQLRYARIWSNTGTCLYLAVSDVSLDNCQHLQTCSSTCCCPTEELLGMGPGVALAQVLTM